MATSNCHAGLKNDGDSVRVIETCSMPSVSGQMTVNLTTRTLVQGPSIEESGFCLDRVSLKNSSNKIISNSNVCNKDAWDNANFEEKLGNFDLEDDNWKIDNFEEQFDKLLSEYMPDVPCCNVPVVSALPDEKLSDISDSFGLSIDTYVPVVEVKLLGGTDCNNGRELGSTDSYSGLSVSSVDAAVDKHKCHLIEIAANEILDMDKILYPKFVGNPDSADELNGTIHRKSLVNNSPSSSNCVRHIMKENDQASVTDDQTLSDHNHSCNEARLAKGEGRQIHCYSLLNTNADTSFSSSYTFGESRQSHDKVDCSESIKVSVNPICQDESLFISSIDAEINGDPIITDDSNLISHSDVNCNKENLNEIVDKIIDNVGNGKELLHRDINLVENGRNKLPAHASGSPKLVSNQQQHPDADLSGTQSGSNVSRSDLISDIESSFMSDEMDEQTSQDEPVLLLQENMISEKSPRTSNADLSGTANARPQKGYDKAVKNREHSDNLSTINRLLEFAQMPEHQEWVSVSYHNSEIFCQNPSEKDSLLIGSLESSSDTISVMQHDLLVENTNCNKCCNQMGLCQDILPSDNSNQDSSSHCSVEADISFKNSSSSVTESPGLLTKVVIKSSQNYDLCNSQTKKNVSGALKDSQSFESGLIAIDDAGPDSCNPGHGIEEVVKNVKKEKPWTFIEEETSGELSWKEPSAYGRKECYCPHGFTSSNSGHFHCQECGLSSRYRFSIKHHEVTKHRVKHPGMTIMVCSMCPAIFTKSQKLKHHIQKHKGQLDQDTKNNEKKLPNPEIFKSRLSSSPCSPVGDSISPSLRRLRHSCHGRNWKEVFDAQNEMEQHSKRCKVDRIGSEDSVGTFVDVMDNSSEFKPSNLYTKEEEKGDKESIDMSYRLIEIGNDGKTEITQQSGYNGPLLSTLLKPNLKCPLCGKMFAKSAIQRRHYAQVHQVYIRGIAVYSCAQCSYRCFSAHHLNDHLKTEKHRLAVFGKRKSDEVADTDRPLKAKRLDFDSSSQEETPENMKPSLVSQRHGKLKLSKGQETDKKLTTKKAVLRNCESKGSSNEREAVNHVSATRKLKWFYGIKKDQQMEKNNANIVRYKFVNGYHLNNCVANHVCTDGCLSRTEWDHQGTWKEKDTLNKDAAFEESTSEIVETSPSKLFQPVILDSFSCHSSNWKAPSENSDKSSSQCASTTRKAIKFYQQTQRSCLPSSLVTTLIPLPDLDAVSYDITKSQPQVALESTLNDQKPKQMNNFSYTTMPDVVTEKNSTKHDCNNSFVVHLSHDKSESSYGPGDRINLSVSTKDKVHIYISGSSPLALNCSNSKKLTHGDAISEVINVVKNEDGSAVFSCSEDYNANTSISVSMGATDAKGSQGSVLLSRYTTDILYSELERREFIKPCVCGVHFLDISTFNIHSAWHAYTSSLKCNFCALVSRDWYEFYSHILNHSK